MFKFLNFKIENSLKIKNSKIKNCYEFGDSV